MNSENSEVDSTVLAEIPSEEAGFETLLKPIADMTVTPTASECPNGNAILEAEDPRVQILRKRLSPKLNMLLQESDCLRFLRARSYNIEKATDMIEKWGLWWETPLPGSESLPLNASDKPDENENVYRELMPHANLGETRNGCPIYWEKTGQISSVFYLVKKQLTEDDLFVRHIRQQEVMVRRLRNQSMKHNRLIEKQVIVMDMKNVSMSMDLMAMRTFHRTVVIDESCYPERLDTLYMINAPFTFSVLWAMIRPWIDPVTVQKFQIIGSNYQDILKEKIDPSQIPVEYGGTWDTFGWTFPHNISPEDRLKEAAASVDSAEELVKELVDSVHEAPVLIETLAAEAP